MEVTLPPAPLLASCCICRGIPCRNKRIPPVSVTDSIPGLLADFQQHLCSLFDAPAALRGQLAEEKICEATTGTCAFLIEWGTEQTALIIGPMSFAAGRARNTVGVKFYDG